MRFVLVETAEGRERTIPGWKSWRATAASEEKTVDVFFWKPTQAEAEAYIAARYPGATFTHKEH